MLTYHKTLIYTKRVIYNYINCTKKENYIKVAQNSKYLNYVRLIYIKFQTSPLTAFLWDNLRN